MHLILISSIILNIICPISLCFIIKHNYFGYGTVGLPKISISIVLLRCLLYRPSREVFDCGCRLGYAVHLEFDLFHLSVHLEYTLRAQFPPRVSIGIV